ncbi:MAG: hypothetical protein H6730_10215 [Deltaproteobacteria bacterium]|nr:hypothetical protein [Deltaproteobacteria bacterium]
MTLPSEDLPLTFDPSFGKLGREIARFANHTRRMLESSRKHRGLLMEASAWSQGAAPLDEAPESPTAAMKAVDKYARVHRVRQPMLVGAYFAHHHLRTQAEASRELLRNAFVRDVQHRIRTCHRIYEQQEATRREWVAALLELALATHAPELTKRDYVAFNVGALVDHEDVDLAIVVRNEDAREALTRGFAGVSKTFLRYASKVQLYLTEDLATPRVGATIEEYEELLRRPARSIVSVMQLLGSQYLCGSRNLSRSLQDRVIQAYYQGEGQPMVHEAFLRSVMVELRHYILPNSKPGLLCPKREIYVPAKLATTAVRLVHGVHEARPPHALRMLADKDPALADTYLALSDAFAQNEVLRALLFLYVSHGDEFDLADPEVESATARVAVLMGAMESARRTAADRLNRMYGEIRARALRAVATLSAKIDLHLSRVSTFRRLVEREKELPGEHENLALRLLAALERYRDSVFWDEVVDLLAGNPRNGQRFFEDLLALTEAERQDVARRYVTLMSDSASALVTFLAFIAQREQEESSRPGAAGPMAAAFWDALTALMAEDAEARERVVTRLDGETTADAMFGLALAFPPWMLARLADLIEHSEDTLRIARVVRALRSVVILAHHRSNYVGRVAQRVLARTPEFLARLGDSRRLKELGTEVLSEAAQEHVPTEQIELLGDSFDVSALRGALIAVLEGAPADLDTELTSAVDQYVRELFKACFRDVRDRSVMFEHYRPGSQVAVFATGGYGRGEAFGADFDYLAVVEEDDRGLKKFFGKVLQRVSAAMTRRGLHPHNRFTGQFNAYVVSVPELVHHLLRRGEETFIDEAEILEARFFLGDPAVARAFHSQVRALVTGVNADEFVQALLTELRTRRELPPRGMNLKEAPGGLREIHLLWLALRVVAQLPGPLTQELLPGVANVLPECKGDLRFLMVANAELRRLRDIYRLVVAFDDTMDPEVLVATARDLRPLREAGIHDGFQRELERLLAASALRVDRVADHIQRRIG